MISNTTPKQTQDPPSKLRKFYDRLTDKGIAPNLPDYQTFETTLSSDPQARRKLYDNLQSKGELSLPDYETFQNTLFEADSKKPPQNAQNGSEISPLSGDLEGRHTTPLPKNEGEGEESGLRKSAEEFGKGIVRGLANLPQSVFELMSIGAPAPSTRLQMQQASDLVKKYVDEPLAMDEDIQDTDITDAWENPAKFIPWLAGSVGEAAPTMIPGLGTAKLLQGAGKASQIAGAALASFPIESGAQIEEAKQERAQEGETLTDGDKALAIGSGMLAAGVEGIADVGILKYISDAVNKSGLDDVAKDQIKKKVGEELAKLSYKSIATQGAKGFGTEAGTEAVQQIIANVGAQHGWDPDREILEGVPEAAVVGGFLGGPVSGIGAGVNVARAKSAQANAEVQPEGQSIDMGAEFNFDPEASTEQQIEQLDAQREQLETQRKQLEEQGEPTQDVDAAIAQLDKIQGDILEQDVQESETFTEREQTEEVNEDPRPAPPEQEFTEGREQQTEPIAVPDNPLPAQVDERYESWIDRDENADVPTIKVRNKEKGQEIDYKSNNRKDVITDFIRQGAPGLQDTESSIQQDIEGMNPEDADQFLNEAFDPSGNPTPKTVLERSENPAEIAEAINSRQQEYNNQIDGDIGVTLTERYWSEGQRLPVSNIKEWADWNTLPQNIKAQARNRDSYEGKLLGADQLAQELSGIMQREVSPEEVVQSFIEYHQSNVGRSDRQFNDPLSNQLARKFKDITGQKYTPSFGQELSQAHQERKASETGIDQDISDYIDANGNINYNELLNSEGAYAEYIGNNSPLTQEEIKYANQQIRQYEQRQEASQQREDSRGNEESEVSAQEDSGVPSQQEQGPAGLKEELSQKLETQGRDQSDYIKRRLQDIRDNPQVQQALEDMGEYTVQNVEAANRESDSLIADLQSEFGQKTGLRRSFKLLKEDQIPELMIGPMADKLALRMQKLNMNAEAKQVIDWMQQKGRDSARALRSMRSDASPESVVSRALAGLETKKQDALSKEFKDGKTYYDALNRIRAVLKDEQANRDNRSDKRVREDMISLVNDILKRDDESGKQRRIRKRTAQQVVDGYLDNLTSEELLNLFDDMAGFEILTTVEKSGIIDGATEVSELLREGKRELAKDKWIDLMEYLEEVNLQSRPVNELVYDLWYTGVLSGLTTVQRSLAGSTITASLHTAMKLMTNPKIAPLAISQMVKGFQGSLGTYINVLKTGRTNVQFADFKPKNPRYTDKLINNSFEDLNARDKVMKAIYTVPVYMYRNILAWDQVLKNGISEANMAFYEYDQVLDPDAPQSRRELIEKVKKNLAVDNEAKAREQARYEVQKMKENEEDIPSGYQARRAREIIHNQRNQEFVDKALTEAARSALVEHPIGTLGKIYQTANQFLQVEEGDKIPLQMAKYMAKGLFPFLRVGANYTNAGLDYTPYGLVRAAKKERWTKHGMEEIGQTERNRIRGSAALGMSVFLSLIYGMFDWDEEEGLRLREGEDRWLDIVGPGTGNWWEQQDIGKGFKPWSIRMRNPVTGEWSDYYSYIDNPVGFALAPIGIMADRQRFTDFRRETRSTDRPEEFRGIKYLFGMGLLGTFQYSMDQSFNQGMNALGDILNSNNPETFSDNMYSAFGRPVEGFYPNVYNQMYAQYRALMDIPERDAEAWYENLARKVPIADGIIKNHRYDVFGYPIVRDFDVPMIPDMVLKMAKDNLTYREGRPEWELLWKYDEVVVGSFLPPFSHEGKRLTNQQRNAYQQEAGVRFRGKIQRRYNVLNLMTAEQLQKELLNYKRESAKEAREVILENKGFRITQPISDEN